MYAPNSAHQILSKKITLLDLKMVIRTYLVIVDDFNTQFLHEMGHPDKNINGETSELIGPIN